MDICTWERTALIINASMSLAKCLTPTVLTHLIEMIRSLIFFLLVGTISVPAFSLQYNQYKRFRQGDEMQQFAAKYYVKGAADALLFANGYLDSEGQKPMYCQPKKLSLGPDTYLNILEDEIKLTPKVEQVDYPVSVLLLWGLQRVFPCPK
jgi:hypothetical protein